MARKLGIIAGSGDLPQRLVAACPALGREPFVVAIEGTTAPYTAEGVAHLWTRLGNAASAVDRLKQEGVADLVFVGPMRRPSLFDLRPDLRTAEMLARVGLSALGDDGLLRAVIGELERQGFVVLGVDSLFGELLAPEGPFGRHAPDDAARADIARGLAVAKALGAVDVGQAVVVQQGMVLGVEAIDGTDALLRRTGELRREGQGGVLVKIKKPGQDRRVDLPTVGVATVEGAAAAGLRGIAIEAGGSLVIDLAAVARRADELRLFVTGVRVPS